METGETEGAKWSRRTARRRRSVISRRSLLERLEPRVVLNGAPVAVADPWYSTKMNTALTVTSQETTLLANDWDPEGTALCASVVAGPSHGSLSNFGSEGTFTYTPTGDYMGFDQFSYRVSDGSDGWIRNETDPYRQAQMLRPWIHQGLVDRAHGIRDGYSAYVQFYLASGGMLVAPKLPAFQTGGKTSGVLQVGEADIPLVSGKPGPAASLPRPAPGFNAITSTHVEGHAAALMRQEGMTPATLYINKAKICVPCCQNLEHMLPPGSKLTIVLPSGETATYIGNIR